MAKYSRIIVVSFIVLGLLVLPAALVQPIRNAARQLLHPITAAVYAKNVAVRRWVSVVHNLGTLPQQNDDLSAEVARLAAENARLKEVEHENTLLRAELNVPASPNRRHLVAARVTNKSPFSYLDSLVIDRGSADGIKAGQAVTVQGNLVGKVVRTTEQSADVQLITSSDSIVQAELQGSRVNGVVRGGIHGLTLESIPQDATITPGESIISNGLGGSLRPGLLIGTVQSVSSKKSDIFQTVQVKPAIQLTFVDVVFVEAQ